MSEYFKAKLDITVTIDGQDETTTIKKGDIYCGYRRLEAISLNGMFVTFDEDDFLKRFEKISLDDIYKTDKEGEKISKVK